MAGAGRGLAAQRAGLARRVRVDHRVPARLAARRQGRERPRRRTAASRSTACTCGSGYYENAFRLAARVLRRARPPAAPTRTRRIQTWHDAIFPAATVGARGPPTADGWHHWLGQFTPNDLLPASPTARGASSRSSTSRRALLLIADFLDSLHDDIATSDAAPHRTAPMRPPARARSSTASASRVLAAILEATARLRGALDRSAASTSSVRGARPRARRDRRRRSRAWSTTTPTCAARGTSSRS